MRVSIIGAGNVAWHLAKALEKAGVSVSEIYARNIKKALELSEKLYSAIAVNSLNFSESDADVFFICVSDDAISEVASQLVFPDRSVVVHTSGAKPLSVLEKLERSFSGNKCGIGVFYPLQTFSKDVAIDFVQTPILIETKNEETTNILNLLAKKITKRVVRVTSQERLVYHTAAVFSCNFVNHLWALSKEILESENLDFEILKPLILETTQKMLDANHPAEVQTGPAVRNDVQTINTHLEFLSDDEDLLKVYTTLTESISDWHRLD